MLQLLVIARPNGELVEKGSTICDTLVPPLEVPVEIEFTLYHDRLKLIHRGSRHHTSNLAVGQGEGRPHLAFPADSSPSPLFSVVFGCSIPSLDRRESDRLFSAYSPRSRSFPAVIHRDEAIPMSRSGGAASSTAELTSAPARFFITASFAADLDDELNVDNSDRSTVDASRCSPCEIWGAGPLAQLAQVSDLMPARGLGPNSTV